MYWPGISSEVRDFVQRCEVCCAYRPSQQKEPLQSLDVPMLPWAKVGCDLFTYQSQAHLIVVDYFSEFWEIEHLTETKAVTVIRKLKQAFARHGVPQIVVSDNGPQFSSKEFQCFANEWQFAHATSSPRNPQSNGRVEGAVKAAKSLIK